MLEHFYVCGGKCYQMLQELLGTNSECHTLIYKKNKMGKVI